MPKLELCAEASEAIIISSDATVQLVDVADGVQAVHLPRPSLSIATEGFGQPSASQCIIPACKQLEALPVGGVHFSATMQSVRINAGQAEMGLLKRDANSSTYSEYICIKGLDQPMGNALAQQEVMGCSTLEAPIKPGLEAIVNRVISTLLTPSAIWVAHQVVEVQTFLSFKDVISLCMEAENVLQAEDTLLHISAPCRVVTDLHGQYPDLMRWFGAYGAPEGIMPWLFLGDYVDRSPWSTEILVLLMALKLRHPHALFLLRGNHELQSINRCFGLHDECVERWGQDNGSTLWQSFNNVFQAMPLAAIVEVPGTQQMLQDAAAAATATSAITAAAASGSHEAEPVASGHAADVAVKPLSEDPALEMVAATAAITASLSMAAPTLAPAAATSTLSLGAAQMQAAASTPAAAVSPFTYTSSPAGASLGGSSPCTVQVSGTDIKTGTRTGSGPCTPGTSMTPLTAETGSSSATAPRGSEPTALPPLVRLRKAAIAAAEAAVKSQRAAAGAAATAAAEEHVAGAARNAGVAAEQQPAAAGMVPYVAAGINEGASTPAKGPPKQQELQQAAVVMGAEGGKWSGRVTITDGIGVSKMDCLTDTSIGADVDTDGGSGSGHGSSVCTADRGASDAGVPAVETVADTAIQQDQQQLCSRSGANVKALHCGTDVKPGGCMGGALAVAAGVHAQHTDAVAIGEASLHADKHAAAERESAAAGSHPDLGIDPDLLAEIQQAMSTVGPEFSSVNQASLLSTLAAALSEEDMSGDPWTESVINQVDVSGTHYIGMHSMQNACVVPGLDADMAAAVQRRRLLCMHGGIGPLQSLDQLASISRTTACTDEESYDGRAMMHVLWSDPQRMEGAQGYHASVRDRFTGGIVTFAGDVAKAFCERNSVMCIVRGHEVVQGGMEVTCQGYVLTIFSAVNYVGMGRNHGCILDVLVTEESPGVPLLELQPLRLEATLPAPGAPMPLSHCMQREMAKAQAKVAAAATATAAEGTSKGCTLSMQSVMHSVDLTVTATALAQTAGNGLGQGRGAASAAGDALDETACRAETAAAGAPAPEGTSGNATIGLPGLQAAASTGRVGIATEDKQPHVPAQVEDERACELAGSSAAEAPPAAPQQPATAAAAAVAGAGGSQTDAVVGALMLPGPDPDPINALLLCTEDAADLGLPYDVGASLETVARAAPAQGTASTCSNDSTTSGAYSSPTANKTSPASFRSLPLPPPAKWQGQEDEQADVEETKGQPIRGIIHSHASDPWVDPCLEPPTPRRPVLSFMDHPQQHGAFQSYASVPIAGGSNAATGLVDVRGSSSGVSNVAGSVNVSREISMRPMGDSRKSSSCMNGSSCARAGANEQFELSASCHGSMASTGDTSCIDISRRTSMGAADSAAHVQLVHASHNAPGSIPQLHAAKPSMPIWMRQAKINRYFRTACKLTSSPQSKAGANATVRAINKDMAAPGVAYKNVSDTGCMHAQAADPGPPAVVPPARTPEPHIEPLSEHTKSATGSDVWTQDTGSAGAGEAQTFTLHFDLTQMW